MARVHETVLYGVQAKYEEDGRWSHVASKEPMFFNSPEEAQAACDVLSRLPSKCGILKGN
jgi:hypothetical protein